MMRRLVLDGVLVVALISFPWFISVPVIVLCCALWADFYEGVIFCIAFDLLYGGSGGQTIPYVALLSIGAFAISPFLRKRLRWYS